MFFGTIATKDPCSDAVLPSPPDPLRQIHSTTISAYRVSNHSHVPRTLSLVDRGANGGVAGEDVRPIYLNDRWVNIQGIDYHQIPEQQIGGFGGIAESQHGTVIVILNQYANFGKGPTIHSPAQFE